MVVLHDWRTGTVTAVAVGNELGPRRTGAIGGAAASALARAGASKVAVIGTGTHAWAQLRAISAVPPAANVRVWSRSPEHRDRFARRAREAACPPRGHAAPSTPSAAPPSWCWRRARLDRPPDCMIGPWVVQGDVGSVAGDAEVGDLRRPA